MAEHTMIEFFDFDGDSSRLVDLKDSPQSADIAAAWVTVLVLFEDRTVAPREQVIRAGRYNLISGVVEFLE